MSSTMVQAATDSAPILPARSMSSTATANPNTNKRGKRSKPRRHNGTHRHHHHHHHRPQPFNAFAYHRGAFMSPPPPALYVPSPTFGGVATSWSHHVAFQQASGFQAGGSGFHHPMTMAAPSQDFRDSVLDPTAKPFEPKNFKPVVVQEEATVSYLEPTKKDVQVKVLLPLEEATDKHVQVLLPRALADTTNYNKTVRDAAIQKKKAPSPPPPGFLSRDQHSAPPGFGKDQHDQQPSPVTVLTPPGWNLGSTGSTTTPAPSPTLEQMKQQEELCTTVAASVVSTSTASLPKKSVWGKPKGNPWSQGSTTVQEATATVSPIEWPSLGDKPSKKPQLVAPVEEPSHVPEPAAKLMEEEEKEEEHVQESVEEEEKEEPKQFTGLTPKQAILQRMGIVYASDPVEW